MALGSMETIQQRSLLSRKVKTRPSASLNSMNVISFSQIWAQFMLRFIYMQPIRHRLCTNIKSKAVQTYDTTDQVLNSANNSKILKELFRKFTGGGQFQFQRYLRALKNNLQDLRDEWLSFKYPSSSSRSRPHAPRKT